MSDIKKDLEKVSGEVFYVYNVIITALMKDENVKNVIHQEDLLLGIKMVVAHTEEILAKLDKKGSH